MRRAILHIGTHKTGTTSIQRFLHAHAGTLGHAGIFVPASGRPRNEDGSVNPAHQLIPWGLMEGTDAALLAAIEEARPSQASTMIISSEELHLLHSRPAMLAQLRDVLSEAEYEPFAIVYLRAQAGYVESIFSEIMKGVLHARFQPFVETALAEAVAYVHPQYPVPLRYTTLIGDLANAFGREHVIVRPYDPTREAGHLLRDFVDTVARIHGPVDLASIALAEPRENQRLTLGEVIVQAHWFATQLYGAVSDAISVVRSAGTTQHDPVLGEPFRPLLREEHLRFIERFADDNAAVEHDARIVLRGTRPGDIAPPDDPRWTLAATQRRILDLALDTWFPPA